MRELRGKVVVVTGASSGLGRETAICFAAQGCSVVLAARRHEELEETARMCRAAGGEAQVARTDVTCEDQVVHLCETALSRFGRIDVWINNAGVTLFAPLEQSPFEEHRRVLETNLYGAMYAARAVVPVFLRQKHGTLINVCSILSKVGQPFAPSYAISKFALRGLTEVLRVELADEPDIHVCSILPYAIDTPHFQAGANAIGHEMRAMPPMQSPEKVARAIVGLVLHPRRECHVPRIAAAGLALHLLLPRTVERLLLHTLRAWHLGAAIDGGTQGNLFEPSGEHGEVHGARPPQIGTRAFIGWTAREFLRIEADALRRRVQPWGKRAPA